MNNGKRQTDPREYRLYLFADYCDDEGAARQNARLHAVRETVNGHKLPGCEPSRRKLYDEQLNYWSYPLLSFFVMHAPVCAVCLQKLIDRGVVTSSEANKAP